MPNIHYTDTGCHLYTPVNNAGYPAHDKHRSEYEKKHGPIPEGFHIHHTCNQRNCINPDHMKAMTRQDNQREAEARRRGQMGKHRLRVSRMLHDMVTENANRARG